MRVASLWVAALVAAASVAAGNTHADAPGVVSGAYIVEFEDESDPADFYSGIASEASTAMEFNHTLFRGASIRFHDERSAAESKARLQAMPAVKRTWPVHRYSAPNPTVHWTGNPDAGDDEDAVLARATQDTLSTHVMTQVDQMHAQGYTGSGIRVAVIDSGVDFEHPDLGGCFGPGCLVSFGTDLVGDDYNGDNTPIPSDSPPHDCKGHGSHVSGIIAAQGNNKFGLVGVAPGVELGMYRVWGCTGTIGNDVLIAAYNLAYEAGVDLITCSIGQASGWPESPVAVVVSRIVANGVACTVSAGNDGDEGLFETGAPGTGDGVASVASVDNIMTPVLFTQGTFTTANDSSQTNTPFEFAAGSATNWSSVALPLWIPPPSNLTNSDTALEGCEPFGSGNGTDTDLSGYVVLLRRGNCALDRKIVNALRRGAKYIFIYNIPGYQTTKLDADPSIVHGVGMVSYEQGVQWAEMLRRGGHVKVAMGDSMTVPHKLVNEVNNATGGYVSYYTSWGPTFEVGVKPQLAAPGGNILSTYPRNMGSYSVMSGTSMACPFAAAVYALIMQSTGIRDPRLVENRLVATANPNVFLNGTTAFPYLAPVPQQGAGLIQAADASTTTTEIDVSSLSFNDTEHSGAENGKIRRIFTISNNGRTSVVYDISHVPAGTAYTFSSPYSLVPSLSTEMELVESHATLSFDQARSDNSTGSEIATITIPAGECRIISVLCSPPSTDLVDPQRIPIYSGYVAINGSDSSSLSLPYLGVLGNLRSVTVLDPDSNSTYLSNSLDVNATRVPSNHLFELPPPGKAYSNAYSNTSIIQVNTNMVMGSSSLRFDLVPIRLCPGSNATTTDVLGYKTIGSLQGLQYTWLSRKSVVGNWDGALVGGKYAPPGMYKVVLHALHIFGDKTQASDYDVKETEPFRLRYMHSNTTTVRKVGRVRAVRMTETTGDECL